MIHRTETDAYVLNRPQTARAPLVFSSPHSGRAYEQAFLDRVMLDSSQIRSSEDAFVDELIGMAPAAGIPVLAARVPRACLDLNRGCDELDPAVIEGIARAAHNPRVSSGLGVIPRVVAQGRNIYRGKIPLAEAEARITRHWHPWHDRLKDLLRAAHLEFGEAVLLDWHSMPHEAIEVHSRAGIAHPEVVLGDRFGASAARDVTDRVEAAFRRAGLRVVRNAPFAGAYIAQTYGRPSQGQHVVQIEIDRALYMDETAIRRSADFTAFRQVIGSIVSELADAFGRPGANSLPLAAE
ncbi:N-formylglutamate amidohydrolase [Gemmobacter lutimaris]|uniref:N-formylglutamate amidohydrolase n=1 Tax=Gemmobacter lutimaris TaxID=2306023 RepID=A0A398BX98_9RHOB|nr:N-formylglutamate amidohydrolase [Gemmobacter lutimaris]RID92580.1 N-formylglutamate amidohydrolase [Gemmobacter lutimaris]